MKKLLVVLLAATFAASFCYAADNFVKKANEPVGAVVEASGVFVGQVTTVVADTMTGKGNVTVADANGQTKIFPVDQTVKVVDATFNALTLNQLKQGEKVSVAYSKDKNGKAKANTITVTQ